MYLFLLMCSSPLLLQMMLLSHNTLLSLMYPFQTTDENTKQTVFKIIRLTNKTTGHKANLQEDYQKLAEIYLEKKKQDVLNEWISTQQAKTYIRIDNTYANCNFEFKNWIK